MHGLEQGPKLRDTLSQALERRHHVNGVQLASNLVEVVSDPSELEVGRLVEFGGTLSRQLLLKSEGAERGAEGKPSGHADAVQEGPLGR